MADQQTQKMWSVLRRVWGKSDTERTENASPKRDIDAGVEKKPKRVLERKFKWHVMNDYSGDYIGVNT